MDASCCIQRNIHVLNSIQINVCPEYWVHIRESVYSGHSSFKNSLSAPSFDKIDSHEGLIYLTSQL